MSEEIICRSCNLTNNCDECCPYCPIAASCAYDSPEPCVCAQTKHGELCPHPQPKATIATLTAERDGLKEAFDMVDEKLHDCREENKRLKAVAEAARKFVVEERCGYECENWCNPGRRCPYLANRSCDWLRLEDSLEALRNAGYLGGEK